VEKVKVCPGPYLVSPICPSYNAFLLYSFTLSSVAPSSMLKVKVWFQVGLEP